MTISYTPPKGAEELIRLMDREYNTWHHSRGSRGQHAKGHGILRCKRTSSRKPWASRPGSRS